LNRFAENAVAGLSMLDRHRAGIVRLLEHLARLNSA
jgi:hypothetical protein